MKDRKSTEQGNPDVTGTVGGFWSRLAAGGEPYHRPNWSEEGILDATANESIEKNGQNNVHDLFSGRGSTEHPGAAAETLPKTKPDSYVFDVTITVRSPDVETVDCVFRDPELRDSFVRAGIELTDEPIKVEAAALSEAPLLSGKGAAKRTRGRQKKYTPELIAKLTRPVLTPEEKVARRRAQYAVADAKRRGKIIEIP